ncbi:MAG: hypothetical protein IAC58_06245 [Firmicutes bacterium]|uniref:Uncharacterized protein n=1 Tax=Candidatus Onthovivens merdipullorum TaxID=2840889 RepID=A0A9D9GY18_9BACL|nr:hypothetical protein [Candidatus Onthovivens merdipullorum]
MKKKVFKLSLYSLILLGGLVTSCNKDDNNPGGDNGEYSATNPRIIDNIEVDSEPIKLKAPFTVLDEEGNKPEELEYNNVVLDSNVFDNLYEAIRIAGMNGSNSKPLQVQDSNFTQVFIRQRASNWFVFDGHDYVGTDASGAATEYIDSHKNSYAITGTGSQYARLGRSDYTTNMELNESKLELNAGAYNYMFSKNGVGAGENGNNINGFSYVTANVRLSEMKYRPSADGDGWNAYIFINLGCGIGSDLGLIGNLMGSTVQYRLFRNCQSRTHGTQGFLTFPDLGIVTQSTKYDPSTGEYSGFDDLRFEVCGLTNGWILNITNLRTNQTFTLSDLHYESDGVTPVNENVEPCYYTALIASSYCPVVGNVWNWDCGASMTNVIWENIEMQRYVDDNIETYRNATSDKIISFTPGSEYMRDGYSQGAFASYHEFGVYEEKGTYASGNTYEAGDTYLSQSVSYTNPWEE